MDSLPQLLHEPWMHTLIGTLLLLLVAWLAGVVTHFVVFRVVRGMVRRTTWRWDDELFRFGVFRWLARIVPTVVVQFGVALVPGLPDLTRQLVSNIALGLMVFFLVMAISAALSAMEAMYRATPTGAQRPIKGLMQLVKLVLFIVAALVIIGAVTDKRIGLLLSGLGAMSAVLILVFKDTILGFVAGIQLSSNDMLRVGDWITMPGAGADGDVIDITLYTVKVRNFDRTIVTIPTWKLISESYQNWRGMSESGGRRIKRALLLDASTAHFLDADEIERLGRFRLLREYLGTKHTELLDWNRSLGEAGEQMVNRRRLTNLGTFRAYVSAYLHEHPRIHREMTCMVRQLPSDAQGIPLELYCFTATTVWAEYETIQSDIFDHLIALLPEFGLALFQQPSGRDVRAGLAGLERAVAPAGDDAAPARKGE
ncbi:mechanosensitive ion channel family protein [Dyella sp.]|jgi:miniconductance mechanosensitive channel|uniref:mechanosensitive ion channel family protein n=1 Tax=Dyella sp. TaxID=1869338 RepID=UPI002D78E47B|nr:mechanosensitive ion channel domain-containing protein [Dyella sp.]HET6431937.1 mechanosensitive ion channel domain-containing protein [Dyella sp.]